MKTLLKRLLALTAAQTLTFVLSTAYESEAVNATYKYIENGIEFTIHDYASNPHAEATGTDETITDLIIPDKVQTFTVDSVTLYDDTNLETVTIPETVTTINISNCLKIREYNIDENNANYCSLDGVIYDKDFKTLLFYPPAKEDKVFTIPDSIEIIGENDTSSYAFEYCAYLEEINFNEGLTAIKDMAFHGCKFEKLKLPNSLNTIGNCSFSENINLKEVVIPENVEETLYSFGGCNNLETVIFLKDDIEPPNYASSAGNECMTCYNSFFEGCEAIVTVYVPDSKIDVYNVISETWDTINFQLLPLSEKPGDVFYGDVNYDGTVSVADVIMLQKGLVKSGSVKTWKAGDLDGNGTVNVFDLILMKRMLLYS